MAGARITIQVDDAEVQTALGRLAAAARDPVPALKAIGEAVLTSTRARFSSKTAPDGSMWAPNTALTQARKGRDNPLYQRGRFIPAGAGNTGCGSPPARPATVHPRGRGEHRVADREQARRGSSPRARGTHSAAATRKPAATVHPRGRGEHIRCAPAGSTRARGTRRLRIPAGAGNTPLDDSVKASRAGSSPRARGTRGNPVHPRWRGEHILASGHDKIGGSSPRARGTPVPFLIRFIPAGTQDLARSRSGSSPRARGTQLSRALT
jgi:hypothetical protein